MPLLTCLVWLQPICYNPKLVFMHVNTVKALLVAKTLIEQQPWKLKAAPKLISCHKSKIKLIVPSKNTFQNTGAHQNCSLKKCISKLLSLKRFLQISITVNNIFTKMSRARFLTKKKKNYNKNLFIIKK